MTTPYDQVIDYIVASKFHNQRKDDHSDIVSEGVWKDLYNRCPSLRADFDNKIVSMWLNFRTPGHRHRKIDLFVGEPDAQGQPDLSRIRFGMENKSVVTAHRNRTNRYDDLSELLAAVHSARAEAVLVGVPR